MREIVFDLTQDSYHPKAAFGGFEGEHNATSLTLLLPPRLISEDGIYYMVFETAKNDQVIFSAPLLAEGNSIQALLPKQVMTSPHVIVHAAAYRKNGEELLEIAKSARVLLEIKCPEGETVGELSGDGGAIPGLVIESTLLPHSENPVSSAALHDAFLSVEGDQVQSAFVDEQGDLILKKKNRTTLRAGNVIGPRGEQGDPGEKGEKGERGEKGDPGIPDYALVANALKGNAEGEIVAIKDSSPLEHKMRVQIRDERAGSIYLEDAAAKLIGGDLENGRTYTVSLCELQADGDEFMIEFENGEYAQFTVIAEEIKPAILPAGTKLSCGGGNLYYVQREYPGIKVTKYGKNLLDISKAITEPYNSAMCSFVDNADGTYTFTKEGLYGHRTVDFPLNIKANTSIMISVNLIETYSQNALLIMFKYADGTTKAAQFIYSGKPVKFTAEKDVVSAYLYVSQGTAEGSKIVMEKVQIEIGTTATEYVPYKDPVFYTPNADGVVEGICGNGDGVTLMTDADGVTITAEYNRDLNKTIARLESALISVGGEV